LTAVLVRTVLVVVRDELLEDARVPRVVDQHPLQSASRRLIPGIH
jgi:hypothetical protein